MRDYRSRVQSLFCWSAAAAGFEGPAASRRLFLRYYQTRSAAGKDHCSRCCSLCTSSYRFEMRVVDITTANLGIRVSGGNISPVISRRTAVPMSEKKRFKASFAGQAAATVSIYQGESEWAKENQFLAALKLDDITIASDTVAQIEVLFQFDENGNTQVASTETKLSQFVTLFWMPYARAAAVDSWRIPIASSPAREYANSVAFCWASSKFTGTAMILFCKVLSKKSSAVFSATRLEVVPMSIASIF
ncbi:hypothetical protein BV898_05430 [Hypsibius exemplaris]|uniref:Uncharacterized protein n=1 Tax=Hypsibius exemplaris TaxID=2072580 RepID=A0A1W0WZH4_HYPEX|nr:hypothetical protein BV898_05430 [Hypsibius exemplaris]